MTNCLDISSGMAFSMGCSVDVCSDVVLSSTWSTSSLLSSDLGVHTAVSHFFFFFFSPLFSLSVIFCPFLNTFSQRRHHLGCGAWPCPGVGWLELTGTGCVLLRAALASLHRDQSQGMDGLYKSSVKTCNSSNYSSNIPDFHIGQSSLDAFPALCVHQVRLLPHFPHSQNIFPSACTVSWNWGHPSFGPLFSKVYWFSSERMKSSGFADGGLSSQA